MSPLRFDCPVSDRVSGMHNNNYTCVSTGAERAADRAEPCVLNSGRGNCTLCVYSWNEFMNPPSSPPGAGGGEERESDFL